MRLPARALRTIRKHGLFPRGARVLVALSGGGDSIALLHILRCLQDEGELTLAAVAHLNHQLRGAEADADEQFCRALGASLGLPVEVGRSDVARLARETRRSLEDAARMARYTFLTEAADRVGAEVVAVGHSLDDQAETVLLRLIRGAGSRGLGAIRPRTGRIVRPLLEISRAELRRYAADHGLTYREDASNADVSIARNRIRLELMPHLEQFSPAIASTLARAARIAREDEEYLNGRAIEALPAVVSSSEDGPAIDVAALLALPQALASRVARLVLEERAPGRFVTAGHIESLLDLAARRDGASVTLPVQIATKRKGRIVFGRAAAASFPNAVRLPLAIPGEVALTGWSITATRRDACLDLPPGRSGVAVLADLADRWPLAVRTRRPGDRIRPLGMGGRGRKLQDLLVDRKVARADRDVLPLVVDAADQIVWVVGHAVAEDFRVTDPSRPVILLTARQLGGLG